MPNPKLPACPTPSELAAFAASSLDSIANASIAKHVESCPQCEQMLKGSCSSDGNPSKLTAENAGLGSPQTKSFEFVPKEPPIAALPEKIGKYFVLSHLGKGGFANVYLARDAADERRLVAIKVLKDKEANGATEQFLHEARTAGELTHPKIVQVIDWGRDERVGCYVVMQYIAGRPLADIYKSKRIDLDQLCDILIDVAEALEFVHSKGLVHRDVKPANILVAKHAYLSDFGLAFGEMNRWTHGTDRAGTPCYMAPEQIRGQSPLYRGLGDVWSFGIVLYEGLTGRKPFSGDTRPQLFDDIQMGVPRLPREIVPDVPLALEHICMKCLEKQAENRYKIGQVLRGLRQWRRTRQLRRWKLPIVGAAMILLAFIGGAAAIVANRGTPDQVPNGDRSAANIREAPDKKIDGDRSQKKNVASITPVVVFNSGSARNNHFSVNDVSNTLQLVSTNLYLVKLGHIDQADCEIGLTIEMITKGRGAGVFIAHRDRQADNLRQFHLISLEKQNRGAPFSRRMMQVFDPDDPASRNTEAYLVGPIKGEIQKRNTIRMQFANGRVKQIVWNGEPVEENGADTRIPKIGDITGVFGVFTDEVAAVFSHLEITKQPQRFTPIVP